MNTKPSVTTEDDDAVITFAEWCGLCGFSHMTGRRLIVKGGAPPIIRLSERRIGIRRSDHRKWLKARTEQPSAA